MNNIDRFYVPDAAEFARKYLDYLGAILSGIDSEEISNFIASLLNARKIDATIFFIGNGGSAATASHFANDLAIGTGQRKKPFRALSLTDNVPILTAIANDFGYEEIFLRQLEILAKPGDILVGISASGNSKNVLKAFDYAKSIGIKTIAITSFDGGNMKNIADQNVYIPTELKEYGPAEDSHMILDHLVGAYLTRCLSDE